jgi:hypothetical protein
MKQRIATAIEILALGLWIGALVGFAFVFAPTAFRTIPDLNTFATLIGATLRALTHLGYGLGAIALLAALARGARVRALLLGAMLVLSAYDVHVVLPAMEATLNTFGAPMAQTPKTDPRRLRYDAEHRWSSRVYGTVLLLGLLSLAAASQPARRRNLRPHIPRR